MKGFSEQTFTSSAFTEHPSTMPAAQLTEAGKQRFQCAEHTGTKETILRSKLKI